MKKRAMLLTLFTLTMPLMAENQLFSQNDSILSIINDPSFSPFGRFIFPTNRRHIDSSWTIEDTDRLLPYHSNIKVETTIDVLNYLKEESEKRTVFYDIYTEKEKAVDPSKRDTGLFFFKGNDGSPFAIISAGGGFSYVGSIHESFPHAIHIARKGYNAFAIQYRTDAEDAMEDLARAISFVFDNAGILGVSTDCYSLWGGSAGARMAAYLGSYGSAAFYGDDCPRAGAVIMQYTGHSDYTAYDPATFAICGDNDYIASWRIMKNRTNNLKRYGIDAEFHLAKGLSHGFGLGIGTHAEGWIDDAIDFWQRQIDKREK